MRADRTRGRLPPRGGRHRGRDAVLVGRALATGEKVDVTVVATVISSDRTSHGEEAKYSAHQGIVVMLESLVAK